MGYLTTITIHNDAFHVFEVNPLQFTAAIFKGIEEAEREHREVSVPCCNYANYISVQKPRHADDETIYLHTGNTVFDMHPWGEDFKELAKRSPDLMKKWLKKAKQLVKMGEEALKNQKKD
jgi:hypothetical protein